MDILNILVERVQEMIADLVRMLPQFAIAALVLLLAWGAATLVRGGVRRMTARTGIRPSLAQLLITLANVVVWIVGFLVAFAVIMPGVNAGTLLAVLGLGSVAIGLAFKDIFENFLAGVLIMLRKKMRIGDYVECEGIEGRVELINVRETYLRKLDNELAIVPNSFLFKNPVKVITDAANRRYEIVVGVAYSTDLDQAAEVIAGAVKSADGIDANRPIEVFAREFNESSIDFTVRWWAGSKVLDMHKTRDTAIRSVKRALDSASIEIPFPQVTATFAAPLRVEEPADEEQAEHSTFGHARR
ncbi:MAG: mechanosensitive ion channel family protein [Pseudomonadota bacterium]|nr:mechanosensitive ion channel family protein [Sphingomonas sp.]MDQ3478690.1 mechanosensitive ion channel family protein [Pseudomonadota bacterium]